jgi:sugar lactone lactonase YvrE
MRNNVNPDGSSGEAGGQDGVLYRVDGDGRITEWKRRIGISNTLAWSPDRTRFYFADTLANTIFAYDYDEASGSISGETPFFSGFERGLPDGSTVDSEGFLWNCRYGGKCIVRIAPEGSIDSIIEMPVTNITSCTFGGRDYKTLYVTTASAGAPPADRLAGGLFTISSDVAGQPENKFGIFAHNN